MVIQDLIRMLDIAQRQCGGCKVYCGNADIAGLAVRDMHGEKSIIILTKPRGDLSGATVQQSTPTPSGPTPRPTNGVD